MADAQNFQPLTDSVYQPVVHKMPTGGVAPDLALDALGDQYLASALNFMVRNGRVRKREGLGGQFIPPPVSGYSTPHSYEWIPYDNSARLVTVFPQTGAFYYNTGANTWTFINNSSLASTNVANSAVFYSAIRTASSGLRLAYVVDSNSTANDPPQWWTGSTGSTFTVISTSVLGTCCQTWRSHFLLGNTTDTGDGHVSCRVHWSALGDPTVWSGTASAGSIDLMDANGTRVMCFLPLQEQLLAYKEEAVHTLTYKASPFYFTQQLLHPSLTLLAPKSVCAINGGNQHFVMTKEGAVVWDGQTIVPVGRDRVDRTILSTLAWSPANLLNIVCVWWPFTREVLVINPASTNQHVWVYNVQYDSWWETDMNLTGATPLYRVFSSGQPLLMGVGNAGSNPWLNMFQTSKVSDATASSAVVSSLQTGFYDYGTRQNKEVDRIVYTAAPCGTATSGTNTTTLNVAATAVANPVPINDFASGSGVYSTISLTTGDAPLPFVDLRFMNRLISYRIQHTSASAVEVHTIEPRVTIRSDIRNSRT